MTVIFFFSVLCNVLFSIVPFFNVFSVLFFTVLLFSWWPVCCRWTSLWSVFSYQLPSRSAPKIPFIVCLPFHLHAHFHVWVRKGTDKAWSLFWTLQHGHSFESLRSDTFLPVFLAVLTTRQNFSLVFHSTTQVSLLWLCFGSCSRCCCCSCYCCWSVCHWFWWLWHCLHCSWSTVCRSLTLLIMFC